MKRLLVTMLCDVRLQFRNGFYYASLFVLGLFSVFLLQVPNIEASWVLPAVLPGNLTMTTFYFIAGLILLEKGEGTLEAQIVSPLRSWEYLAAKVITLCLLALVENLILTVLMVGWGFGLLPLLVGLLVGGALFALVGFLSVARYSSINEYLMPSMLYTVALSVPLVTYIAGIDSPLMYLHPMQASLLLLKAAFVPTPAWQVVYGLVYGTLWLALLFRACQATFVRFVLGGSNA